MKHIQNTFHIAWITVQELLFEKVFYLLVSFALFALGLSFLLSQLTYTEQLKILLDFMLGGIQISMILFSVFMGISLFHRELTLGSVYMILSKPVSRSVFLFGKFLGQVFVQFAVIILMGLVVYLACMRFDEGLSVEALIQTLVFTGYESAVIAALTYFFAVNTGAVISAALTLCLFALGHARGTVNENIGKSSATQIWEAMKQLIPDLEVFNMKALTSYGISIPWNEFWLASLYALTCVGFLLFASALSFHHKDITT